MPKNPSGLFSKKGKKAKDIKLVVINRFDREEFFRSLREFGWEHIEGPFEFELKWPHERIRKSAREHAAEIDGDLLIEIRDKEYSTNPYNDYVYYIWRTTPGVRGIPPPPSYQQTAGFVAAQQIQQQQAVAREQHMRAQQQAMAAAAAAAAQAPPPQLVSSGGTCPNCKGNQVQYFNNGLANCPQCGSNFQWQQPPAQPVQQPAPQPPTPPPAAQQPPPAQMPPRPPPQVQLPAQQPPAPQQPAAQPQRPAQQPPASAPPQQPPAAQPPQQQPGAPQQQPQQQASYCPKCRVPLTKYPDGRMICSKCGMGQ